MIQKHHATCHLCEANCGIVVEHESGRITSIRGDRDDPLSRGHICPKAAALRDLHDDPDRLRRPLERTGSSWREIGWDEALDKVAERLSAIQAEHGKSAVAVYVGNPTIHSYAALLYSLMFVKVLRTRNFYSSNSVDAWPRLFTSYFMYGSQFALPVPDLDRTQFLLVLGANPAVSNGSVMTAPDCKHRLGAIRARGGKVVVIDPRRTETAELADEHHFIRPGADAFLLAAMLHTIVREDLAAPGRFAVMAPDLDVVEELIAPFSPEAVAGVVGMAAADIRGLARDFARASRAVCYGRLGTCTQRFGALTTWLIDCLNMVTGNLDREGGAMFTTPAVDMMRLATLIGQHGHFGLWKSRVSGYPEFSGELPAAALAEEIETPGPGQVRALVTHAGNPVLSLPNGKRLDAALSGLDFMVSVDIYLNETTRHANIILPPTFGLERDHFALVFHTVAVRNTVKYTRAMLPRPEGAMHDWEIFTGLMRRVLGRGNMASRLKGRILGWLLGRGPEHMVRLGLRMGPHKVKLGDLLDSPHGMDLGPLEPRLTRVLRNRSGHIHVAPEPMVADMARLGHELETFRMRASASASEASSGDLVLIGRRELRSNNSWMHNVERLVRGKPRCVLFMHPADAEVRGVVSGDRVSVRSRVGEVEVPVQVTTDIMQGVVSLPHGWGHDRGGIRLGVASRHVGVSLNDITDEANRDPVSGCTSWQVAVRVEKRASVATS